VGIYQPPPSANNCYGLLGSALGTYNTLRQPLLFVGFCFFRKLLPSLKTVEIQGKKAKANDTISVSNQS
jgi:hypothetical protein